MKKKIKDFGEFNCWRGCMGLYFNTTLDDKGVICAAQTKRECQLVVKCLRKFGRYSEPLLKLMCKGFPQ